MDNNFDKKLLSTINYVLRCVGLRIEITSLYQLTPELQYGLLKIYYKDLPRLNSFLMSQDPAESVYSEKHIFYERYRIAMLMLIYFSSTDVLKDLTDEQQNCLELIDPAKFASVYAVDCVLMFNVIYDLLVRLPDFKNSAKTQAFQKTDLSPKFPVRFGLNERGHKIDPSLDARWMALMAMDAVKRSKLSYCDDLNSPSKEPTDLMEKHADFMEKSGKYRNPHGITAARDIMTYYVSREYEKNDSFFGDFKHQIVCSNDNSDKPTVIESPVTRSRSAVNNMMTDKFLVSDDHPLFKKLFSYMKKELIPEIEQLNKFADSLSEADKRTILNRAIAKERLIKSRIKNWVRKERNNLRSEIVSKVQSGRTKIASILDEAAFIERMNLIDEEKYRRYVMNEKRKEYDLRKSAILELEREIEQEKLEQEEVERGKKKKLEREKVNSKFKTKYINEFLDSLHDSYLSELMEPFKIHKDSNLGPIIISTNSIEDKKLNSSINLRRREYAEAEFGHTSGTNRELGHPVNFSVNPSDCRCGGGVDVKDASYVNTHRQIK